MRILVQRVESAEVKVNKKKISNISKGLLIFFGVTHNDNKKDARFLANKVSKLRIFENKNKKMNFSIKDVNGDILVVSQFTLYGNSKKGNRPSFINSAPANIAEPLYEYFINLLKENNFNVKTGIFGENMDIKLINQGPVTILLESHAG